MVLRFSRGRVGSRLFKVRLKGLTFFCLCMYQGLHRYGIWVSDLKEKVCYPPPKSPAWAGDWCFKMLIIRMPSVYVLGHTTVGVFLSLCYPPPKSPACAGDWCFKMLIIRMPSVYVLGHTTVGVFLSLCYPPPKSPACAGDLLFGCCVLVGLRGLTLNRSVLPFPRPSRLRGRLIVLKSPLNFWLFCFGDGIWWQWHYRQSSYITYFTYNTYRSRQAALSSTV